MWLSEMCIETSNNEQIRIKMLQGDKKLPAGRDFNLGCLWQAQSFAHRPFAAYAEGCR